MNVSVKFINTPDHFCSFNTHKRPANRSEKYNFVLYCRCGGLQQFLGEFRDLGEIEQALINKCSVCQCTTLNILLLFGFEYLRVKENATTTCIYSKLLKLDLLATPLLISCKVFPRIIA